ncbi:YeiH family protein [Peptostreptococcus equinus]|uniref:YeiH family protein n=1 Tax=Peptostreptococcus equinus TaxID=3003601 RepID=A0ABY7JLM0_9FIRM|nr:YeiH family protein [Peptostreptococcus sp. CBA3647]WAW14248.1 YeiH family protein [Peptostreptococcus sp. CBA3647]
MGNFSEKVKGIVFCVLIAIPAYFLGKMVPIIGGPVFSIIIGMILANLIKGKRENLNQGINFTSKKILQYAVILLGFGLNLQMIIKVGKISLPIIMSTILTSLIVSYMISKAFNIPAKIATLIGVGSSICGGSAIAATAPVIDADNAEIAQAISVIFFFNVIAAIIFPSMGDIIGMTNQGFALFAGTAVNDTSSVTAAASSWDSIHRTGSMVLDSATIVKLTRTLAIIPITFCLSIYYKRKESKNSEKKFSARGMLPSFILYFILCSIITTIFDYMIGVGIIEGFLSSFIAGFIVTMKAISKFFIIMAMGAIGLNTNIVKLIRTGQKPLLLGMCCWISIIVVSISMQKILGIF